MAEVFVAHRLNEPAHTLVLKRIRPDLAESDEYLRRFVLEAQILSRLSHPNLVRFREFGKIGECHYIAMDLVKGYTLSRLIDRVFESKSPPPLAAALHIGQGVLDALAEMHAVKDENGRARPILHRDVTPNNVIVTHDGNPVLIDFGIAKDVLGPAITLPGKVIGTTRYMSPEHRKAEFIDTRADVFSASVILFELLVGAMPWKPLEGLKELLRVTFDPPEVPEEATKRIPEDVLGVIMKGLECDPQDRHASAEEMSKTLKRCTRTSPPEEGARATSAWLRSLDMLTDDDLEDPVLDYGPQGSNDLLVWTSHGSIDDSGGQKVAAQPPVAVPPPDARIITIPPLPPPREAVLATGEINVDLHGVTGRPVWVTALLITALVLGVVCGVILLRGGL
jgi:serine/threonine-protein kinase